MSSSRSSIADKLRALMAGRRGPNGRSHTSRSLSASVDALPGEHPSVSFAAVAKIANGSQDNPTVGTLLALCEALGVPPAHLLPHEAYDDLEALKAFEDPLARQVLALLNGLPASELRGVITDLEGRRAHLGLEQVPRGSADTQPRKRNKRRRKADEAAEYAADSLEGL
ncbi:helix-turn-helix domain-containing protein [Streptomyces sp. H27-H5]|uniref:helix-turn-helix domain-containing protein n=1 Tax=Streptomyces sp. H27-H5 TaxID=2996460 RepID=UPI002272002B|nr:helix-turn-helix domain-containing protein [Streptomyces sp. H27-H5]MCY0961290.1 helix-turn-helix domain-containing protein [Streptomyces sp. H27-H5]